MCVVAPVLTFDRLWLMPVLCFCLLRPSACVGSGGFVITPWAAQGVTSVLSQLSGLENVVFNDFIDALDSEDVSEQRASASLPDSVPLESEEERAAREAEEMAALDSVGD